MGDTFVHLHTHSEFSPIDSLAKVKDLVKAAAADQNPALAVSDHGTLGGVWKLGQYARDAGIKPIPAIEAYLAIGSRFERNALQVDDDDADPDPEGGKGTKSKKYEHLTLLAATREGWRNLVLMTNEAQAQESYWYKPRIDYDLLAQYGTGLIVMTGCLGGPVAGPLSRGDRATAVANLHRLIDCVGRENVYVEVMDHGIDAQLRIMDDLRSVAEEVGARLVATNDSHYIHADQHDAHDAWLAVGTSAQLTDEKRFRFHGTGHHLRTETEMRALQGGAQWWQQACDETARIAARVADDVLPAPRLRLPKYPLPDGYSDAGTYLKDLVRAGAFERYGADPQRSAGGRPVLPRHVNEQLKFEFGVIDAAGLPDYFLIVWDVISWARSDRGLPTPEFPMGGPGGKKPIRVGPGRGSAAGAAISYCLKIVGVDPLANGLLFERFLNPERTGMPDIDVDFEQGRRPEVLRYIAARFGKDRVAQIGTFGIARTREAIKDAARVLGLTPLGAKLSSLVPLEGGKPLPFKGLADPANKACDAFRSAVTAGGSDGAAIVDLASAFEDVTKKEGVHPCGTLIADEPMAPLVPLRTNRSKDAGPDPLKVTVWDGKDVDKYGLLKMDVLGLRNLDVVSAALDFIEADTGERVDPDTLVPGVGDDRDARVWDLISSGRTAGVFQLESPGMTRLAEAVAPSSLSDLTALVALYRPGPMAAGMHDHYAARKHGREPVSYEYLTTDPTEEAVIASVLDSTYGVVAYQEQLMALGGAVGGLAPAERNKLQKAFSKKQKKEMAELKEVMFAGALAGAGPAGVKFSAATLERLWVTFDGAASYLFNASHACAYGFISYQTAYLKANWPVQYGAALLACTDDDDKRLAAIRSLQAEGVTILAPDINRSHVATRPDVDAVRLGLSEVKGVGSNAVHIVAEREANGPYTGVADVLARVVTPGKDKDGKATTSTLQANKVEALVQAGAFDEFGPRLGQAIIARGVKAVPGLAPVDAEWGILERSAWQRDRLGLITGVHPLVALKDQIASLSSQGQKPSPVRAVQRCGDGDRVMLLGVLAGWSQKGYRGGQMVTLTVEGSRESVEGVMWEDDRRRLDSVPTVGDVVVLHAQVRVRIVETERVDEDGETVTDSFERRDLTVRKIATVPLVAPGHCQLPAGAGPVDSAVIITDDEVADDEPTAGPSPEPTLEPTSTSVDAPPVPEYEDSFGDWPDDVPPDEPVDAPDEIAPVTELRPTAVTVIRLQCGSLAGTHPAVRAAAARYDLPEGFLLPEGGVWSVVTDTGLVVVVVGEHEAPTAAHHLSKQAGWSAVTMPQPAAA